MSRERVGVFSYVHTSGRGPNRQVVGCSNGSRGYGWEGKAGVQGDGIMTSCTRGWGPGSRVGCEAT
eukprot:758177-Hanusia_phi.AAC.3